MDNMCLGRENKTRGVVLKKTLTYLFWSFFPIPCENLPSSSSTLLKLGSVSIDPHFLDKANPNSHIPTTFSHSLCESDQGHPTLDDLIGWCDTVKLIQIIHIHLFCSLGVYISQMRFCSSS